MRRFPLLVVLALVAASCSSDDTSTEETTTTVVQSTTTTTAAPATTTTEVPGGWFLAWQPTELVGGFTDELSAISGVSRVSMVRVGEAQITTTARSDGTPVDQPDGGYVIPVEVHAVDGSAHSEFVPGPGAEVLAGLADDEVILGSTSARLRRLEVGDTISFLGGPTVTVAGVIDDDYVGDAEVVTARPDPEVFGRFLDKYAVFWFDGERSALEQAAATIPGEAVTIRAWGEVLVFRHGDSVRSQVAFKDRFGEFTIRLQGGGFEQEPAWRSENIVTETIPLLGSVTCHRDFVEMLRGAMEDLEAAGNGGVIKRSAYQGCWNPRFIAGRLALSHHSFGAAADINFFEPLDGPFSPINPDLLVALYNAGMTSGHVWVNPDPGHFEWFDG
ncbi:MAG: hypothetical protein KJO87_02515 [Acidimicrobiia bacterium]|nr:hypothetical protein [Acidimicrobiia bacterium]NNL70499.1 hypothetical protein [Acidimicrobiia bacterium]